MNRRLFLKRASQACGVLVFLPAARAIGKIAPKGTAYYEHTILAMDTTARVGVFAASEAEANHVITAAFAELKRIEATLTIFDSSSEISKINAFAGQEPVVVSDEVLSILKSSVMYSRETSGAFDITVEPLMRLWGFRQESNILSQLPSKQEIELAIAAIGPEQILIQDHRVQLRSPNSKIDLGGIAVGYALDRMATTLRHNHIENAFIDISGDMLALGANGSKGWHVAIPDPNDTRKIIYDTYIRNEALATSGNYMSFVTYQAQRFGHIMDPGQGRSAHRMLSATVIAPTGIDADALSTASFVTGERYRNSKLILVGADGHLINA